MLTLVSPLGCISMFEVVEWEMSWGVYNPISMGCLQFAIILFSHDKEKGTIFSSSISTLQILPDGISNGVGKLTHKFPTTILEKFHLHDDRRAFDTRAR